MAYKVYKLVDDRRNHTCGFTIPNGGFYWVLEMTFENYKQLTDLSNRAGYSVDFVEGPLGFFDKEGYQIDPDSVETHKISKQVLDYKRLTKKSRGKDVEVRANHKSTERTEAIDSARRLGYSVSDMASTQQIKKVASRKQRARQSTLTAA